MKKIFAMLAVIVMVAPVSFLKADEVEIAPETESMVMTFQDGLEMPQPGDVEPAPLEGVQLETFNTLTDLWTGLYQLEALEVDNQDLFDANGFTSQLQELRDMLIQMGEDAGLPA